MLPWFRPDHVGNPSSIHTNGLNARKAVEKARGQVANMIGADPSEIFFTSGGTESNNLWLACVEPCIVSPTLILTTKLEHYSVLKPILNEENRDMCAEYVSVHEDGTVDLEDLDRKLPEMYRIMAVSVMCVNNELGSINPLIEIGSICKKYNVLFHVDAVAAAGHIPINVHDCRIDFLSLSGHKFGAPQGIGALYISNRIKKRSMFYGGGQESGVRPGTENVPGIVAIGAAAEIAVRNMDHNWEHSQKLRSLFVDCMESAMPGLYRINGGSHVLPNIISLTVPGVNGESLLLMLDHHGIRVSAGSACSASSEGVSHVLHGIRMPDEDAACTIRISIGFETTESDIKRTVDAIAKASKILIGLY